MEESLHGTTCFNEIRRRVPSATQRTLTNQLRELEHDGLVIRKVYAQVPPKVEYSISELGLTMAPILRSLKVWGNANMHLFVGAKAEVRAEGSLEMTTSTM